MNSLCSLSTVIAEADAVDRSIFETLLNATQLNVGHKDQLQFSSVDIITKLVNEGFYSILD